MAEKRFEKELAQGGAAVRVLPPGAAWAFGRVALGAFACLAGFVLVFGPNGEALTAGVDMACAHASFGAGKRLEALGNYEGAAAQYRRAFEGRFGDPESEYVCGRSLGELYLRMGRYSDAIDVYRNLPSEAFRASRSMAGYVTALFRGGDDAEAERLGKVWLEKANAEHDVQQMVWSNHTLGLIAIETGRADEAMGYFRAVGEVDPANRANLDIGRVLSDNGCPREALAQLDVLVAHTSPGSLQNEAGELRTLVAGACGALEASPPPSR